ncbi:hypothetical protein ACN20G_35885 (plasmid) [Streptomyces sp. BI20]|uniref:hypothetical protein n=1 Tax=Streptomyces sp. BI20 TaxID=3403460 RepID=UPI003C78BEF3
MNGPAGLPRHYRTRRGNRAFYGFLSLLLAVALIRLWINPDTFPPAVSAAITAVLVLGVGWLLFARARRVTSADAEGITIRGYGPRHRLRWDEIHDIRPVDIPAAGRGIGPSRVAYVYRVDGRRVQMACVDDAEQRDLEWELAALRDQLFRRRNPHWTPDSGAEPRIARQNARWAAYYRWASGWRLLLIVAGTLALGAAIIATAVLVSMA